MGSNRKLIIAGAHVIEAAYLAFEEQPDNPQVRTSIDAGIECTELDVRTPRDCLLYTSDAADDM
eukprot:1709831-Alexandrium_andersonii.AAC.1